MTGIDEDSDLPGEVLAVLKTPFGKRSPQQSELLQRYCADHAEATEPLRIELENLEERVRVLTEKFPTMVMDESVEPRETHILIRGNYASPGEKVTPGTPAALLPPPANANANRLGLAEWLTMPTHPLTARVAVNRIWQMLFGTGIVSTAADFGSQGTWPTHPDLLDWLAVDFVESGWDTKALVRKIVTSATYRQTSATSQTSTVLRTRPGQSAPCSWPQVPITGRIHSGRSTQDKWAASPPHRWPECQSLHPRRFVARGKSLWKHAVDGSNFFSRPW